MFLILATLTALCPAKRHSAANNFTLRRFRIDRLELNITFEIETRNEPKQKVLLTFENSHLLRQTLS